MRLSVEDYRTVGKVTGVMGAVTGGLGVYLVVVGTSDMVVSLFLLSWGITFLTVAMYARKALQVLRMMQRQGVQ
jgi:hypothetical protein